jgi:L-serine dehydratase
LAVRRLEASFWSFRFHKVSLDIATRQTDADMQSKYKETSLGGLGVNFVEC